MAFAQLRLVGVDLPRSDGYGKRGLVPPWGDGRTALGPRGRNASCFPAHGWVSLVLGVTGRSLGSPPASPAQASCFFLH